MSIPLCKECGERHDGPCYDEDNPCEAHTYVGNLDLGPCPICYGTGWVQWVGCPPQPCPNAEDRRRIHNEHSIASKMD